MANIEIELVREWVEQAVLGLGLCPFAGEHWHAGRVRLVVTEATSEEEVLEALRVEVQLLEKADPAVTETTLLIVVNLLREFGDYNEFIGTVDELGERLGWTGHFQIASFHPDYQFAGTRPDDPENLTNRSPYPLLHVLRESTVTRVLADSPDPDQIPLTNIATLRGLSDERRQAIFG
ncbi:MAG: hypothetical protein ACI8P0_001477 [Planctomycetaceae bacterium]|jgi:hypothetical protein